MRLPRGLTRRRLDLQELPVLRSPQGTLRIAPGSTVAVVDDGSGLALALVQALEGLGLNARLIAVDATDSVQDEPLGGLILVAPPTRGGTSSINLDSARFLKKAFRLCAIAGPQLRQSASQGGALLLTITRLDGGFGLLGHDADPTLAGLNGLPKTAAHEWPEVVCRAFDVAARLAPDEAAKAILAELAVAGPLELGWDGSRRRGLVLVEEHATPGPAPLGRGDVVLVTGGARGVTAATTVAMAQAWKSTFVLLGRSAPPEEEPIWLRGLEGEAAIKRAILSHHFANPKEATPRALEGAYRDYAAAREIRNTLARIEGCGGRALYRAVDVRNPQALRTLLAQVRAQEGPIRGFVHAAGVLADRRLEDKTDEQFNAVFDTKIDGLFHLLAATTTDELRIIALFSSVTSRFGRPGQVDYCMANEIFNKVAWQETRRRPHTRVVSMNWGPWDGGMVNDGLRKEFGRLGVALIPLEGGAQALVRELQNPDRAAVEVLIGDGFPAAASPAPTPAASLDLVTSEMPALQAVPGAVASPVTKPSVAAASPVTKPSVAPAAPIAEAALPPEKAATEVTKPFALIDLEGHPYLASHQVGGRPVMPVAMLIEMMAQAIQGMYGRHTFVGVDALQILRPLALEGNTSVSPKVVLQGASSVGNGSDDLVVPVQVESSAGTHARARIRLASQAPKTHGYTPPRSLTQGARAADPAVIYAQQLFHGTHFQVLRSVRACGPQGVVAELQTTPPPHDWITTDAPTTWLTEPGVLDGGLQLGLVWCFANLGVPSLPTGFARYRQLAAFPSQGVAGVLEVRQQSRRKLVGDVVFTDARNQVVARFEGLEWAADASLFEAFGKPKEQTFGEATEDGGVRQDDRASDREADEAGTLGAPSASLPQGPEAED